MINLRQAETVNQIVDRLMTMEADFKKLMESGTEQEQDQFLEKALKEVEKLNGKNATYKMWYMTFCAWFILNEHRGSLSEFKTQKGIMQIGTHSQLLLK